MMIDMMATRSSRTVQTYMWYVQRYIGVCESATNHDVPKHAMHETLYS